MYQSDKIVWSFVKPIESLSTCSLYIGQCPAVRYSDSIVINRFTSFYVDIIYYSFRSYMRLNTTTGALTEVI